MLKDDISDAFNFQQRLSLAQRRNHRCKECGQKCEGTMYVLYVTCPE